MLECASAESAPGVAVGADRDPAGANPSVRSAASEKARLLSLSFVSSFEGPSMLEAAVLAAVKPLVAKSSALPRSPSGDAARAAFGEMKLAAGSAAFPEVV